MGFSRAECERLGIGDLFPARARRKGAGRVAHERFAMNRTEDRYAGYPGRWEIVIPGWRPTLDNELKKVPFAAHRLKKKDAETVAIAVLVYGVPRAIGKRRLTLTIRNRFGSFPDDPAPLKSLWDALKVNGLIVDDSRKWLEMVYPPTFERGDKGTVILLEDVEDAE